MNTSPHLKGLGFKRDLPDIRDFFFESPNIIRKKKTFPTNVDYRNHPDMPPVYDQGAIGSCVAQSVGAICDFKQGRDAEFHPSTLFLYYVTRFLEGTVDVDSGSTIRNGIKASNEFGVSREETWPYIEKKFKTPPSTAAFDEALGFQAIEYKRVKQRLDDIRECLYLGNLIAFGICVYDGLYSITKENPVLEIPNPSQPLLGGHAVVIVGYDDKKELFLIRNSWGEQWGEEGYFYIPYSFVLDARLSMDFWTINLVEK